LLESDELSFGLIQVKFNGAANFSHINLIAVFKALPESYYWMKKLSIFGSFRVTKQLSSILITKFNTRQKYSFLPEIFQVFVDSTRLS